MPRRRVLVEATLAEIALASLLASQTSAEVPHWIATSETEEAGRPLWVSAEEAAPNGFLRWELFLPEQQTWLRENLELNARARSEAAPDGSDEPCITWIGTSGIANDAKSAEELLERSGVVYSARIEDAVQGFLNGHPGTMIHGSVREVLKKPSTGAPLSDIFVFYRYAEISLEGGNLCARDSRGPAAPQIGGVIVLAPRSSQPQYSEAGIFVVDDTELFFDTEDGISTPHDYEKMPATTSDPARVRRRRGL